MIDGPDLRHAGASLSGSASLVGLALAVGAACGYASLALAWLIGFMQKVFFGVEPRHLYSGAGRLDDLHVLLAPVVGGLIVGVLVRVLVPGGRGLGPEDAMHAVREGDARMPLRAGIFSAIAAAVAVGSGASLGRYGPAVHLGASVAAWIGGTLRRVRAERHVLIGCGVAAAISAAFSAPLAGVLFAHEVMLETFARRGFVAITIAAVTGQAVARAHDAHFMLVSLSEYSIGHNHEHLLFALVGVCGGLLSLVFIRGLEWSAQLAQKVRAPDWTKPAIAGLAVGALAIHYPQVLGLGDEAVHDAVEQVFGLPLLLTLIVAKLFAACLCRGFGFPGGVFGPALFLGVMMGSAIGQALRLVDPALVSSVPIYAVAGMGAVVSCVIGAPIATILLVFELTGSYALTTAVMVAVVLASLTMNRVFPFSWFNLQLLRRGVDVRSGREVRIMRTRRVGELTTPAPLSLGPSVSADDARRALLAQHAGELLVADHDGVLLGQISLGALVQACEAGRGSGPVAGLAAMPGIVLQAGDNLDEAMKQLRYFMGVSVPVVDSVDAMHLTGVVYQSSVIGAYNDAVEQARAEERGQD